MAVKKPGKKRDDVKEEKIYGATMQGDSLLDILCLIVRGTKSCQPRRECRRSEKCTCVINACPMVIPGVIVLQQFFCLGPGTELRHQSTLHEYFADRKRSRKMERRQKVQMVIRMESRRRKIMGGRRIRRRKRRTRKKQNLYV